MMNSSTKTRSIVEGALLASLTAVLAVIGLYIPVLRLLTDFVVIVPIIIVSVNHGVNYGFMSLIVAGLLITLLSGPVKAIFVILQFGGIALFFGYAFHKKIKAEKTLLIGVFVAIISMLVIYLFSYIMFGFASIDIISQMKASIEPSLELYKQFGLLNPEQGLTEETYRLIMDAYIKLLTIIIPAMLMIYGLSSAFLNYIVAQKILKKLKISVPELPSMRYWRLPWWTIWGFILGYGAMVLGNYFQNTLIANIGLNIMIVYGPVLFILGLAVVNYYIKERLGGAGLYRLLLVIFIMFFMPFSFVMIAGLGLFDLLFNYRRLPGKN